MGLQNWLCWRAGGSFEFVRQLGGHSLRGLVTAWAPVCLPAEPLP